MLLILAARNDSAAVSLAERWRSRGAALLTAKDLSLPGWVFRMPANGPSRLIAGGRAVASSELAGVLTRIPVVCDAEVDHVAAQDRSYVATEMTAFLLAWISSLRCPVVNRPEPDGLCGPNWRLEQWIHLAAKIGIPVNGVRRSTAMPGVPASGDGVSVTVVGEQCIGAVHPSLAGHSRRLAAASGVDLLEARFTSGRQDARLQSVSLWPDVSRPDVADALLDLFDSRAPC